MRAPRPVRRFAVSLLAAVAAVLLLPAFATAQETAPDTITVAFSDVNDSGVQGTATLTAKGDRTLVVLDVTGAEGEHPDHIHRSDCDDPEPDPLYPLTDVVLDRADETGHSETTVDVPLADLLAEPHLILIHKSAAEIDVYIACAELVATGGPAAAVPQTGTGVGFGADDGLLTAPLAALLLLAAAGLAVGAVRLGRAARG